MIALATTRLRRAIDAGASAAEIILNLSREGYLSDSALNHSGELQAIVQGCIDAWDVEEADEGDELSIRIEHQLSRRALLSAKARTRGNEPVPRGGGKQPFRFDSGE